MADSLLLFRRLESYLHCHSYCTKTTLHWESFSAQEIDLGLISQEQILESRLLAAGLGKSGLGKSRQVADDEKKSWNPGYCQLG